MSCDRSVVVALFLALPVRLHLAADPLPIPLDGDPVILKPSQAQTKSPVLITFKVQAPEACRYEVELTYACEAGRAGSEFEVACGGSRAAGKVLETGGAAAVATLPVGGIEVPQGPSEVVLRFTSMPEGARAAMDLRQLVLRKGFSEIFDGKSLKGWQGDTGGYAVKDGYLYCMKEKGGNLLTEKEYADFVVRFEFRLYPGSNNGLGLRTPSPRVDAAYEGMEIQILDDRHAMYKDIQPWQAHGSIYHLFPAKRDRLRLTGEWNVEEVVCHGRHVAVILNGFTIVDANLDDVKDPEALKRHPGLSRKSGYLGFLGHGSQVDFRKIRLKEIKR